MGAVIGRNKMSDTQRFIQICHLDTKGYHRCLRINRLTPSWRSACPSWPYVMNLTFLLFFLFFFFYCLLFNYYFYPISSVRLLWLQQPRSAEHSEFFVWASLESLNDTNMTLNMTATKQNRNRSAVAQLCMCTCLRRVCVYGSMCSNSLTPYYIIYYL